MSAYGKRAGSKLPRGPHRLTDEQVAEDQRRRLIAAMIQFAGKRGYAATTVAELIKRAGVSRKTFYEHFSDRKPLLIAAFDDVASIEFGEARAAPLRTGGGTPEFEALMHSLCMTAQQSPGAIALCTIEIAAARPEGLERRDRLMSVYGELIAESLHIDHETLPLLPGALTRTCAGSIHRMIDARLRMGRTGELSRLAPELAHWVRCYYPPPRQLTGERAPEPRTPCVGPSEPLGGRAPGTLTLAPNNYKPPMMKRSPMFIQHANRQRILDSVARLTAAHGYTELTAQAIAEDADLSERGFLAHFKSKDDAFAAAVELGHMKGQAIVERARANAPDWLSGVRDAVYALLRFLAGEPYFTRLAYVDAPLAGPAMARRTYEHTVVYAHLMLEGAPQRRRPPLIAPEAVTQGLFELVFQHAAKDKVEDLTQVAGEAAYLALAPFVSIAEAAEATG